MSDNIRPTVPGVHLKIDGEWVQLPEALPWDTIKWERHFGVSQAVAMSAAPPMMEHLFYSFFLLAQRTGILEKYRGDSDEGFERFINSVSDMEMVEEPADPQDSAAE